MNDALTAAWRRAAGHQRRFDARFATYFDSLTDPAGSRLEIPRHGTFAARALQLVRELSLRGGKRLRVTLLHEAAGLVTDESVPGLDEAAISIELLQTHGLIHDDIIDDAPTRRGGPSTYYAYRQDFPDRPGTALALAVLAGDLAAFLAGRVLLTSPLPPDRALAMAAVHADTAAATVAGQLLDLERDFHPAPDTELLHEVTEYKSTRYSILAPLRLGLLAAGADLAPHDGELRSYATALGIANQIHDDWLDLFGDPQTLGKPVGSDIRSGRRSYAVRAFLAVCDASERKLLNDALGAPGCDDDTLDRIRALARAHGIDRQLRADADRYARQAAAQTATWREHWRPEAVAFFEHMPAWSVTRDR
ncbi:geranylgeranyl diphosphate synthase type I [Streptomyces sp. Ag109_G2-6]|uniref:polyprenyl synthetase family protein n=1 Tax=Streptomyces TaxID=1883 RepID=UPI0009A50B93|nr:MULTISPECIES: polyprenyl synthetase family protein [Streptomyces]RPF43712.1 geranylgeranyl diphosphate synthase type I [Streptomyces sp. Ag109_G2-6]